ncbi:MAG: peptidase M23 [Gemmatimonadetes bacterium]|nr:peptidase M23 [Gemmatimonadota bacterium]
MWPHHLLRAALKRLLRRAVPALATALALGCVLLGGLRFVVYFAELHAERAENDALHNALDQVCAQVAGLEADLGEMRETERRMRVLAGIEGIDGDIPTPDEDPVPSAQGEDERVRILRTSLERTRHSSKKLSTDIEQVHEKLERNHENLDHVPSILPTDGWLSAAYGRRRDPFTSRASFHWGVDIAAWPGTEVVATADGKVVFSGRNGGYGNQVKIDHGNGYVTTYAHNKKNLVKRGAQVNRGEPIALLGSTGRSTSSHVHYEVHLDGKKVNPWRYLLPEDAVVD